MHRSSAIPLDASSPDARRAEETWCEAVDLAAVPERPWRALAEAALAPNPYYDIDWARQANATARVTRGARALLAWQGEGRGRLIGLLPVVSAWRAVRLPLPVLFAWQGYGPLTMPLVDRRFAPEAWRKLRAAARAQGARAVCLPFVDMRDASLPLLDPAGEAAAQPLRLFSRARLDARQSPEAALVAAFGANRLRTLKRSRRQLEREGPLRLAVAATPETVGPALEIFLALEQAGWKGGRGTALAADPGDAAFIRAAAPAMAAERALEVLTLMLGDAPLASGLVLRQGHLACWFKIGTEPAMAKYSPGLQLALDVTRHYCADPTIEAVDSSTDADTCFIDALWPDRTPIGGLIIPTRPADPLLPALRAALDARETARRGARWILRRMPR